MTYQLVATYTVTIPVGKASSASNLFVSVVTSGSGASTSTRMGSDMTRDGGGSAS